MNIQWFPGHMAKARREVEGRLRQVDVVMELLDARLPLSSRNPMLNEMLADQKRLVLLNKSDLADPEANRAWERYFMARDVQAVGVNARTGEGINKLPALVRHLMRERQKSLGKKGVRHKPVRCMVIGIPNVGKSSLINRLSGRSAAKTGGRPGVTKGQQWITVGKSLMLLDTPGILWPKFDDPLIGKRLAASGAIKADRLPAEEVALYLVTYIHKQYPGRLAARYKVNEAEGDALAKLEAIGRRRGCVLGGGAIDLERASNVLLHDFQLGKLGRISLEHPADWDGTTQ